MSWPEPTAADDNNWVRLAKARGVRLPRYDTPITPGKMEAWLKKLGWSLPRYKEWYGESKRLRDFIDANPEWSLREWVGLLLEAGA